MPTESALIVAAIVLAFTSFAIVLAWADFHSRDARGSSSHS